MSKQIVSTESSQNESQSEIQNQNEQPIPQSYSKSDYIKARAVISAYKEQQKSKPKRVCSQKQLEALAKGREKARANRESKKANKTNLGEKK